VPGTSDPAEQLAPPGDRVGYQKSNYFNFRLAVDCPRAFVGASSKGKFLLRPDSASVLNLGVFWRLSASRVDLALRIIIVVYTVLGTPYPLRFIQPPFSRISLRGSPNWNVGSLSWRFVSLSVCPTCTISVNKEKPKTRP
jgi:hypothetical protein